MRTVIRALFVTLVTLILMSAQIGCSGMKNGSVARVTPSTTNERVGSVYLLRGWIGIFSTGIDSLGKKLNEQGIHAEVFQEAQWSTLANAIIKNYKDRPDREPIVIIGHSYGADDAILISRKLNDAGIKVELVITLDPVTPRKVPSNIERVYNLYQSNGAMDSLPWLRGIALTPDKPGPAKLDNVNIRKDRTDLLTNDLDHFNIEKKEKIHNEVITQVMKVCEPRQQWTAARQAKPVTVSVATPVTVSKPAPMSYSNE